MPTNWTTNATGEAATLAGTAYGVVTENATLDGFEWAVYPNYSAWSYMDTPEGCGTEPTRRAARDAAEAYATAWYELAAAST